MTTKAERVEEAEQFHSELDEIREDFEEALSRFAGLLDEGTPKSFIPRVRLACRNVDDAIGSVELLVGEAEDFLNDLDD